MNIIRKAISTFAGVSLAVLLFAALVPKATRGVAAALVQVTNTSANPVPNRNLDTDARQAVVLVALTSGPDNSQSTFTDLENQPFTVPAGKRLVFEFISGFVVVDNDTSGPPFVQILAGGGGTEILSTLGQTRDIEDFWQVSQPLRGYLDPGSSLILNLNTFVGTLDSSNLQLVGHLIDCSSDCSAIQ